MFPKVIIVAFLINLILYTVRAQNRFSPSSSHFSPPPPRLNQPSTTELLEKNAKRMEIIDVEVDIMLRVTTPQPHQIVDVRQPSTASYLNHVVDDDTIISHNTNKQQNVNRRQEFNDRNRNSDSNNNNRDVVGEPVRTNEFNREWEYEKTNNRNQVIHREPEGKFEQDNNFNRTPDRREIFKQNRIMVENQKSERERTQNRENSYDENNKTRGLDREPIHTSEFNQEQEYEETNKSRQDFNREPKIKFDGDKHVNRASDRRVDPNEIYKQDLSMVENHKSDTDPSQNQKNSRDSNNSNRRLDSEYIRTSELNQKKEYGESYNRNEGFNREPIRDFDRGTNFNAASDRRVDRNEIFKQDLKTVENQKPDRDRPQNRENSHNGYNSNRRLDSEPIRTSEFNREQEYGDTDKSMQDFNREPEIKFDGDKHVNRASDRRVDRNEIFKQDLSMVENHKDDRDRPQGRENSQIMNANHQKQQGRGRRLCERKYSEYIERIFHNDDETIADANDSEFDGRVLASPGEYPHMTALGFKREDNSIDYKCGGSLISENFVITAAHCTNFTGEIPTIARIGDINLMMEEKQLQPQMYRIQNIHVHPQYDGITFYNDIALLQLNTGVELTEFVRPIKLWSRPHLPITTAFAMGYGATSFARAPTQQLTDFNMTIIPNDECNESLPQLAEVPQGIVESQICAEDFVMHRDTCQGDSGGPLQYNIRGRRRKNRIHYQLIGITSFGMLCRSPNPGVYTRVYSFLDWIERIVWGSS